MKKKNFWKNIQWPAVMVGILLGFGAAALVLKSAPPFRPISTQVVPARVHVKTVKTPVRTAAVPIQPAVPVQKPSVPIPPSVYRHPHAKVAIVLDDWGYSRKLVPMALGLGRPVTLSVLPNQTYSKAIAQAVQGSSCEVMLHMPMEPYDEDSPREPQVLTTGMPQSKVEQMLEQALATVPYAQGVNNHQGSKATENLPLMRSFLAQLKARRLFFLDSMVTDQSVGRQVAQSLELPFVQRSVFLDNVETLEAVRQRLFELTEIALRKGSAVGIGHDKKVTLEALQQTMPEMERQGIEFVHASELARTISTNGEGSS